MSRALLLACCVLALLGVAAAHAHPQPHGHHEAPRPHLQPATETLQHLRRHAPTAHAGAPSALAGSHRPSWTRSVYKGVDRAVRRQALGDLPGQVRLAFIPGGMSVSWSTQQRYAGAQVVYGLAPERMTSVAMAAEPTTYGTLWFYTALLPNLGSGQTIFYEVMQDGVVRSFEAPLAPGDARPFTALVVGDMGLVNSANTMKQMAANLNVTDFILHIGDLSYADDFVLRPNDTYEGSWDQWQDEMEPITSAKGYMSLPGNHEVVCTEITPSLCPPNQLNFTAYNSRFRMPSAESGGVDNLWYSFDYGMVHFVQINTETDYPDSKMGPGTDANAGPFGDQLGWLEADLQKAQAGRKDGSIPWLIVSGHRPWYGSGKKCDSCQDAFEGLLLQYGVDLYFSGHVHWYERLWPLGESGVVTQQDYVNPAGIVYIINGAAGNVEGHKVQPPGADSAFTDGSDFGYGKLNVINTTAINWQFFRAADASLVDDITIVKQH